MKKINRIVGMLAVVGLGAAQGLAQNDKPAPANAAEPAFTKGSILLIEFAGMEAMMSDPKDRAMAAALAMLPARVRELPREIKQMPPEASRYINLGLFTLSRPARAALTYNGENPAGGFFGYGLNLSFLMGEQKAADELQAAISPLAAQSGMRIKTGKGTRFEGMSDITTPLGPASFGPRQGKDGWRYEVAVGTVENQDGVFGELPEAPKGMTPIVRARLDGAGLTALQKMGQGFAKQDPKALEGMKRMEQLGLSGGNVHKMTYVAGTTKDESVSFQVVEKAKTSSSITTPLAAADFALFPSDATDVMMSHGVFQGGPELIAALVEFGGPEVAEALNKFREHTGVDLQADLIGSIGTDAALYMSDTTGGGGLGSVVAMVSLKDRTKLLSALNKLAAVGNSMADRLPIGPGYIRVASWKDGETDLMTLRFPGLPVPLELSMGLTSKWLILSPTPQGTLAATRQASGKGDGGLMNNPVFKSVYPSDKQATSFSFSDTGYHLRDGYSLLTLVGSAVSNAVRSPTDPTREPGMTVPPFNELRKGVKPRISYSYWRGDDRVTEVHSDKSVLVAGCGAISTLATVVPLVAIPAGIAAFQEKNNHWGMEMGAGPALAHMWMRAMPVEGMGAAELISTLFPAELALKEMEGVK